MESVLVTRTETCKDSVSEIGPEVKSRSSFPVSNGHANAQNTVEILSSIILKSELITNKKLPGSSSSANIKKPPAVCIKNGIKRYGKKEPLILNGFCMSVQQGTIYSLLGPSGCGKTTLLSCVVGLRHLNSGEILVFGSKPGTKESGIPGKRVGYMPQDLALYNDFSIKEILRYFGTLYAMPLSDVSSQQDLLIKMLALPDASKRIGTLSGGQKRRVSLAVALIHSPELLILDEPTVGIDPLLRERIWNHLRDLVLINKRTVIMTTHYIEEARESHTIGLMREGRLLVEQNPESLIQESNANNLEEIVLQFCRLDDIAIADLLIKTEALKRSRHDDPVLCENEELPSLQMADFKVDNPRRKFSEFSGYDSFVDYWSDDTTNFQNSIMRIKALAMKNIVVMMRNLILFLFLIFVPAMQVVILCMSIGSDPKPMNIGVVNRETNDTSICLNQNKTRFAGECDIENLSCRYLAKLPDDIIVLSYYDTEDDARDAIHSGKLWGFMSFPDQYSDNLYGRVSSGYIVGNDTLEGSLILFEMDMSNKQIGVTLKRLFYMAYMDFVKELLTDCGLDPALGESPLKYLTPVYGNDDTDFREFVAPSVLLSVAFFFPLCSSSISYIWDKKQGTLERALIAGVQTWELMTAFFITEGVILLIQLGLSFGILTLVFGIVIHGSALLALFLALLMGLGGVSMGFLIGSFCNEEIEAVLIAIATYFPNCLLSGMLWPVEGMPIALQYFTYLLPSTLAGVSIRSIINRGWGFLHIKVWPGFVSTISWILLYWILVVYIHKVTLSRR